MAIDINHCLIEGRLGADPEERVLGGGSKVVNARIACNDDYKNRQTQQWVKRAYWITIAAFGYAGDQLAQFRKGDRIIVTGKWTVEEFTKEGRKNYYNKLAVHDVRGSEIRRDTSNQQDQAGTAGHERNQAAAPSQATRTGPGAPPADFDDDIPF